MLQHTHTTCLRDAIFNGKTEIHLDVAYGNGGLGNLHQVWSEMYDRVTANLNMVVRKIQSHDSGDKKARRKV